MNDKFICDIPCMDVGEEYDIGIADDLSVLCMLMLCCLGIDRKINGERTVYYASLYLTFFIHFSKLCRLHCSGHLLIYHLYGCNRSYLGHIYAARITYLYGILYYAYLLLQGRIGQECHIRKEQQL